MSHPTADYVTGIITPLVPAGSLRYITGEAEGAATLRITVCVNTARAKSCVIGRGGENIHAIQHLANERQHRDDPALKVKIDVILAGGDA